jgi:hypothetical protein
MLISLRMGREKKRSVMLRVVVGCHLVWVDVDFAAKGKRAKKERSVLLRVVVAFATSCA